jgi:hypothetical protein
MDSGIVANEVVARLFKTARCRAAIPVNEFATDFPRHVMLDYAALAAILL